MNSNSLTFQPLPIGARELSVQENHDVAGGLVLYLAFCVARHLLVCFIVSAETG